MGHRNPSRALALAALLCVASTVRVASAQYASSQCRAGVGPDVQRWVGRPLARAIAWFGQRPTRRGSVVELRVECGVQTGPLDYWTLSFVVDRAGAVRSATRVRTGGYGCAYGI